MIYHSYVKSAEGNKISKLNRLNQWIHDGMLVGTCGSASYWTHAGYAGWMHDEYKLCKCTYKMGLNGCFHSNSSSDVKILHPSPLKGRTTTSRSAPNIYNSHEFTKQKDAILHGITWDNALRYVPI